MKVESPIKERIATNSIVSVLFIWQVTIELGYCLSKDCFCH